MGRAPETRCSALPENGTLSAEEETPSAGSCAEHRGCRHPRGAGGLGIREGQRSPGSAVGQPGWAMLGWLLAALALAQGDLGSTRREMEILAQSHRDGVKMVNPRGQRAGAGASGTGQRRITGEGEHGGLRVRIAGAAALIPHLSNMASRQQPHHCSSMRGMELGCRSLQPLPCPAGTLAAHDVSCWKKCNTHKPFHCSWPPLGPAGNTSYILNLCFEKRRLCRWFEAGTVTNYSPSHRQVYIFDKTTAWVEARWGDQVLRTPNHTLHLNEAVKLDPPPTGMSFSKTGGQLRVQVPRPQCHGLEQPPQHEARFWRVGDSSWTQVTCETVMVTAEEDSVTCALGVNGTFVVQLRHKPPHRSSYWSDWSSNISVPEEILRRPVLSHQLGRLGRDGQRVLKLSWQPVLKEQRDVTYKLDVNMLACGCAESDEEDTVVLGGEVTEHNLTLSGAEYEILLTAVNAAGPGPAQQLRVPAEQRAGTGPSRNAELPGSPQGVIFSSYPQYPPFHPDLSFKEISVAGSTVTVQWEAPVPGDAFCFEQQTLPEPPKQGVCIQQEFPANSIHVQRGELGAPGCHRLAVHGWDAERGWATFALWHRYTSNGAYSLDVPFTISTSNGTISAVVLRWEPAPRAACPGALAKYLICHVAEGDNVTYSEVDATASNYTLQNLQPGTGYRVGVREVTEDSERTCSAWWPFQTKALGPQGAPWRGNLKYLGISLGLPAAAAIYHLSKRRARRLLFPPLPKPVGTKAIQFSAGEMSQGQPRTGLLEPSERFNPAELLLTEPNPSEETTDTGTQSAEPHPDVSQPGPALEKPAAVVMSPAGCGEELPFAYRRQEMLSPVGSPPSGSPGCTGHPPGEEEEEEEERGRQGLHQPLIPIALLISDKPIIIRGGEGWDPSPEKSVP
ncbi:LOW QUALITY PROTEIN: interleukin-12 receptor subunit beta-1 [Anomalospiza imberbis]|uniref:LOW QUALITY PROTEIN: interleukin-12 receptor subunit beta-1 n=1 Tax=Anomalospiza imberbis TaxID=187417 RepID=UPI00358F95D7